MRGYGTGQGKHAKKKGGEPVSFKQVGNVKGGKCSEVNDSMPLAAYNGRFGKPGMVAGSHRKTYSVGVVRGSHRKG